MKTVISCTLIMLFATIANAKVVTETIEYTHGETVCEGYLAYDDAVEGKRPGVLVVHAWRGLGDDEKTRARDLAELGYIAFALDMYGKGVRPENSQEASEQAGIYRGDRELMRNRAKAGLDVLRSQDMCDVDHVAAIGYCFGGGTVLELARSGADIEGVVSFHGNLDTPDPSVAKNIKCKILVCHGDDDPHVPQESVQAFREEMKAADVDYQFIAYANAVHSFTNPNAGDDPSNGSAYNPDAARRAWQHMKDFFAEIL